MTRLICRHLRTKKSAVPALQDPGFMAREHQYSQYFCLKTLHVIGLDDDVVCPGACTEERQCFEPLRRAIF